MGVLTTRSNPAATRTPSAVFMDQPPCEALTRSGCGWIVLLRGLRVKGGAARFTGGSAWRILTRDEYCDQPRHGGRRGRTAPADVSPDDRHPPVRGAGQRS